MGTIKINEVDINSSTYYDDYVHNTGSGVTSGITNISGITFVKGLFFREAKSNPDNFYWKQIPNITINGNNLYLLDEGVAITGRFTYTLKSGSDQDIYFRKTTTGDNSKYNDRKRIAFFISSGGGGGGGGARWANAAIGGTPDTGGAGGSAGGMLAGIISANFFYESYNDCGILRATVGNGGSGGGTYNSSNYQGTAGSSGGSTYLRYISNNSKSTNMAYIRAENYGQGGVTNNGNPGAVRTTNDCSRTLDDPLLEYDVPGAEFYIDTKYVTSFIAAKGPYGGGNKQEGKSSSTSANINIVNSSTGNYKDSDRGLVVSLNQGKFNDNNTTISFDISDYNGGFSGLGDNAAGGGGGGGSYFGSGGNGSTNMSGSVAGSGGQCAGGAGGRSRSSSTASDLPGGRGGNGIVIIKY